MKNTKIKTWTLILAGLAASSGAYASGTRTVSADQFKTADATKTYTLPAQSGTSSLMVSAGIAQETPGTACNSSATTHALANTPGAAATLTVYLDGITLTQGGGADYTISGSTITMATACATGQSLWAVYSKY